MKVARFLGDSRKVLQEFPKDARQEAGYQLRRIQSGLPAEDFKPMRSIGEGVEEIHAFQKKTRTTSQRDIEIARERFRQLMRGQ
jgi:phage-related protein